MWPTAIGVRSARAACWLLFVVATGLALLAPAAVQADELDDRTRHIAKQLRCPICESVSVADSTAELAVQMRAQIRRRLEAGESDQQIVDSFVVAYGDSVLLEPPRRGLGWLVWLGPFAVVAAGAAGLWLVLRGWVRRGKLLPVAHPAAPRLGADHADQEYNDLARRELEAAREGTSS